MNRIKQVSKEEEKKRMDSLYEENLQHGYKINSLNEENNFYRIQINNVKKLNKNIHKDLNRFPVAKTNKGSKSVHTFNGFQSISGPLNNTIESQNIPVEASLQNNQGEVNAVQPLFIINNKIKLKNLQMKVGNSIRQTDKLKKNYDGSLSTLIKKSALLEAEISELARTLEQVLIESQLLSNIYISDHYQQLCNQILNEKPMPNLQFTIKMLEQKEIEFNNKLEMLRKEEKHQKKIRSQLSQNITLLKKEAEGLREQNPQSNEIKQLLSSEVTELNLLERAEENLQIDIAKQDQLLEEQYKINQQLKQKIADKKEQESKELKVLEEEVQKCKQQVKEIQQKYKDLTKFAGPASNKNKISSK